MNKKLFFLMAITLPLLLIISCEKENDESAISIIGKTYNHRWQSILDSNKYYTYSVRFLNNSEYEFAYKHEGEIISTQKSTYTLNYPNIQFKAFGTASTKKDVTGVFLDENTFRVGSDEYIKQ